MSMTIVTPPPAIDRDRYGRPMVLPPGGGKKVAYTRATTFVDCIEDKFNLQKWMLRMTAIGLSERPDLLLSVSAHKDDKRELDRICTDAKEAAAASAAATTGTALHALTELVDRGQKLPVLPDTAKADLAAYAEATASLKPIHIERFTVLDSLKIGGTPDRIVEVGGERYIADLKTGSIEWGALKIAAQLAVYSRSWLYDHTTGERTPHGASTTRGIIVHLPAGQAECHLHWVDLEAGWEAVKVAKSVRDQRGLKFGQLTRPFVPGERVVPSLNAEQKKAEADAKARTLRIAALESQIRACPDADTVRSLWASHSTEWDDHLTEIARQHINSLPAPA
jgi:hypothetical protein